MTTPITEHEGKKYLRTIHAADSDTTVNVDVYSVLEAFGVTCPARAHAVKKLLCCGTRGKGDAIADLMGVLAAVNRAVELERKRIGETGASQACSTSRRHTATTGRSQSA